MASKGYPKWLLNCKEDITKSKEWNSFLHELHDAIQQQLTESHVQYFTDLSDAEKELFMQRATKAIEGGSMFRTLFGKVSTLMDQYLNEDVARQLMEEYPLDTKSDLIIEGAEEGAVSLLRRWPEMKVKLHICLNQPLPANIRALGWRLYLNNPKFRKTYVDILNGNPRSAISPLDLEISQKCEQLLNTEPTLSDLKGSVGAFYGMKAVLSYHHTRMRTKSRLRDIDYMLVVPFVLVALPNLSRREPAPGRIVAQMVEEYLVYLDSRPGYVIDSGSEMHNEEMKGFVDKVGGHLQTLYPDVSRMISKTYVPAKEKIVATEKGSQALLNEGLTGLIRPLIRTMFVGYLKSETLLFVWDQYVIGLDVAGFSNEWLAVITATIFGLLADKLQDAQSPSALENVLMKECPRLTVSQFQYEIKRHHYRDLYAMLTHDQKAAMPVLDPTQAENPPWRHWHNDLIPPYTKPQDRRKAREEREAERERLLQQQREAEQAKRDLDDKERKEEEDEYMQVVAAERARLEQERIQLEDQLHEERRRRLEAEQRAEEELQRLRMEVETLKRQKPKSPAPSVYSVASYMSRVLLPPPPTPASHISSLPVIQEMHTPSRQQTPADQTDTFMFDFIRRMRISMDKIAHGEGSDSEVLNRATEGYVRQNIEDLKKAQYEVFGKRLNPGEFELMTPQQQQEASDKMMQLIQRWREDRRAVELGI
ncbi:LOW QUALITY PROTEIN: uncharacterized protein LOC121369143 [Gigantopelta aegis]|uniref:LOW QUALITY PROTEIN: uncharacterized protein LOC121369143 n=1 Tax=Gigantopelta aegis TaxID=1735272 RepID=UPI001B888482|nr:LOW QUALITY PROTEIN: uncharacterized protein LOC121369143 [Gigantopelta aegis]